MSELAPTERLDEEPQGDKTLLAFWKRMAAELPPTSRHVLNDYSRALAERGWVSPLGSYLDLEVEHGERREDLEEAVRDLVRRRLLVLSDPGSTVRGLLGGLSTARTPHRAHLANGVDLFTLGGLELLSVGSLFDRAVDGTSPCGQCSAEVSLHVEGGAITRIAPNGAAGFLAEWDGRSDLASHYEASPLFCSDACLAAWGEAHGEPEGVPLAGDLLLFIGPMMATESGGARFEMISQ